MSNFLYFSFRIFDWQTEKKAALNPFNVSILFKRLSPLILLLFHNPESVHDFDTINSQIGKHLYHVSPNSSLM